jgi:hypothetical protein
MYLKKQSFIGIIILAGFALASVLLLRYTSLPYYIYSRAVVMPLQEWSLHNEGDVTLVSKLRNNLNNTTSNYTFTELQRGDLVSFVINEMLLKNPLIYEGDTIATIISLDKETKLIELKTELDVKRNLLNVYLSGAKPEDLRVAYETMLKTEHAYATQEKQTKRQKDLFEKEYIATEVYELSVNDLVLKKQQLEIARATYESLKTGAKKEQIEYIFSSIKALEQNLEQAQKNLDALSIILPITGKLIDKRGAANESTLVTVADLSSMIIIIPIASHQVSYVELGQTVSTRVGLLSNYGTAEIVRIDNTIQMIDQRQQVFVTALVENENSDLMPGMVIEVRLDAGTTSLYDYLKRLFRIVYSN